MHVISIDIGTYSVKFVESKVDKKQITHFGMREIVLAQYLEQKEIVIEDKLDGEGNIIKTSAQVLEEVQLSIVEKYMSEVDDEVKVIFQAPNQILIDRFLELPIANKKKAELMIPFQLEEDIPFVLREIHKGHTMVKGKDSCYSLVSFAKQDDFQHFFGEVDHRGIIPENLTSETSCFNSYFSNQTYAGAYMILDIGHTQTRGYIFLNNRLISSHISYIAGHAINQAIEKTYSISQDEAVIYKHQNCYFLTKSQFEQVDENQKAFANLMHKTASPLLNDIKRWELGFRVKHGIRVSNIYICGGTSNIKNIGNYLTQQTGIKTSLLDTFERVKFRNVDTDSKFKNRFNLCNLMSHSFLKEYKVINMLNGEYAQSSSDDLPLHSISHISLRMAAVCLVAFAFLGAEYFFLKRDIKQLNSRVGKILKKNKELQITGREIRLFKNKGQSDRVLKKLKRIHKSTISEVKSIQKAINTNSLDPLLKLSSLAAGNSSWLKKINVTADGMTEAEFGNSDIKVLEQLQDSISGNGFKNAFIDLDTKQKLLKVEFRQK